MAKLVSKTYGDALFELALEENRIDSLTEEIEAVKVILDVSREHAITCTDLADIFAEDEKIKAFRL